LRHAALRSTPEATQTDDGIRLVGWDMGGEWGA
jgi:hypothetical protein